MITEVSFSRFQYLYKHFIVFLNLHTLHTQVTCTMYVYVCLYREQDLLNCSTGTRCPLRNSYYTANDATVYSVHVNSHGCHTACYD